MSPEPYFNLDAQAIWDAFELAECDEFQVDPRRAGLAAALREASKQITNFTFTGTSFIFVIGMTEGADRVATCLTTTADRLHPRPVPTYKGKPASSLTKEELIEAMAEQAAVIRRMSREADKALDPPTKPLPDSDLSPFPPEHDDWGAIEPGDWRLSARLSPDSHES